MGAVLLFTEDHREMKNPAACNVSMTKYVVTTDPVLLSTPPPASPCPHYLNIKTISLARHGRQHSLLWG